jgi:Cft2 family RNA processing exonuclease
MSATLTFLGAAGTVTGSKHFIESGQTRLLMDCGLFQGLKSLRQRNWAPCPAPAPSIAGVLLSHAHIDHSGALPRLGREGFKGPIYCTGGTAELLAIMLPDAAHLQEEEAQFANRHQTSKHEPALPLFTAIMASDAYSAHADQAEILKWLGGFTRPPETTYIVHGEPDAASALQVRIAADLEWRAVVAQDGQRVDIG